MANITASRLTVDDGTITWDDMTIDGTLTATSLVAGNLTITTSEIDVSSGDLTIDVEGSDILLSAAYITPNDGYGIRWSSDVYIYGSSANAAEYIRMDVPAKSGAFYMDRAGQLGLGTTTPALNIGGQSTFDFTTGTHLHINDTTSGESAQLHLDGHAYAQITMSDQNGATDQKTFGMRTDGNRTDFKTLGADIGSGRYFLSMKHDDGRVGIGTTAPQGILDVRANNSTSFDAAYGLRVSNHADASGAYAGIGYSLRSATPAKAWIGLIYSAGYGRGDLVFLNDNSGDDYTVSTGDEVMRITHEGNVGIGTTDSHLGIGTATPGYPLTLYHSTPQIEMIDSSSGAHLRLMLNGVAADITNTGTGGDLVLDAKSKVWFKSNGNSGMYMDSSRNFYFENHNIYDVGHADSYWTNDGATFASANVGGKVYIKSTANNGYPSLRMLNPQQEWRIYAPDGSQTGGGGDDGFHIYDGTNSAYRISVTTGGKVGIGTAGPNEKLTVIGNIQIDSLTSQTSGEVDLDKITFSKPHNASAGTNPGAYDMGEIRSYTTTGYAGGLDFYYGKHTGGGGYGLGHVMRIGNPTGEIDDAFVGIGTKTATEALHVVGNILASGNITAYSDTRLKENIIPITSALDKVSRMNGVNYNLIESGEVGVGVLAQELEEVAPELVHEGHYKSIAYGNLTAYLVEAIKELKQKVEDLENGTDR